MRSPASGSERPTVRFSGVPGGGAMSETAELVIVGAGVIGPATAFAARRAGLDFAAFTGQTRHDPKLHPNGTGHSGHGVMASIGGASHLLDLITGKSRDNPFALDRAFVPPRGKIR
jgi:glycine/D-amino acid oxidase-like deaminating enzyme